MTPTKLYRHKKTGTIYEVLAENGKLEATWEDAVIYRKHGDKNSEVIARSKDEFFDGRFEAMGPAPVDPVFDPMADIIEFHEKFDLDYNLCARALPKDLAEFRIGFFHEELSEYRDAQSAAYDETTRPPGARDVAEYTFQLEMALDALVDKAYVLFGTVYLHGFGPVFAEAWRRVHVANMAKVRAELDTDSKRGSAYDVVKPAGWEPPTHTDLVEVNDIHNSHFDRA